MPSPQHCINVKLAVLVRDALRAPAKWSKQPLSTCGKPREVNILFACKTSQFG
jgi:hypothetical protein